MNTNRMILPKLIFTQFAARKVRTTLTVLAILFSISLVVAVTSGYASAVAAAEHYMAQYMGANDATITKPNDPRGLMDEKIVAVLTADPDVKLANGRFETQTRLMDLGNTDDTADTPAAPPTTPGGGRGRGASLIGVRLPQDHDLTQLEVTEGQWFTGDSGDVAVVDQVTAEMRKLKIGDTLSLPGPSRRLDVKVVGMIRKPAVLAMQQPTIYVPLRTLQKFAAPKEAPGVTRITIVLKPGVDAHVFAAQWRDKLATLDPTARLRLTSEQRQEMSKNLQGIHALSYAGGVVSMVAAGFIIFSTLTMGVAERQRTLAMMRAVGAVRGQIARLVVVEALALSGIAIAIGVPIGLAFVWILVHSPRFQKVFASTGMAIDKPGLALAVFGSLLAAVLASLLPAWQATRVDPLSAMTPLAAGRKRFPWIATLAGLFLIALDPFIMFGPIPQVMDFVGLDRYMSYATSIRFYGHFAVGSPGVMFGFFLLAPALVVVVERVIGPVVAVLFGLRFTLLKQQLSGGLWRAAGTAAALMVGLAVLVVLQIQGRSALAAWKLPVHFPDVFIFSPIALSDADIIKLQQTPGVKPDKVMPIAIASPQLGSSLFAIAGAMQFMPDATMFFGLDPDLALEMMELDFRDNNGRTLSPDEQKKMRTYVVEKWKLGRHVVITDEFRQLKGLKLGDKLPLKTPLHGTVDYTICGIVWSPGVDVMTSRFDLGRQLEQRTASSVFGTLADARNDFGIKESYLLAANLEFYTNRDQILKDLKTRLARENIMVADVRQIKKNIEDGLGNMIALVSTVAFAAMAVAALGVANTIMASVRSRRWQFGVLRSIGVTRGQLLRLVLAEAVLLGIVGMIMGLAAGGELAIDARELSRLFVGFSPPLIIPVEPLARGAAIIVLLTLAAGLWPAVGTARTQPLDLLSAGRASA